MFEVTLYDHLRFSFGQIVQSHKAHLEMVDRLERVQMLMRWALLGLLAASAGSLLWGIWSGGRAAQVVALIFSIGALGVHVAQIVEHADPQIAAHRLAGARLWHIRERYRGLLADMVDGTIDATDLRKERDALAAEVSAIYENVAPADRRAYLAARRSIASAADLAVTDVEIDRLLPSALRKTQPPSLPSTVRHAS
jgi:hypothetical protein